MKRDVELWASGQPGPKLVSKETLNHRALIERISGLDVYEHTGEAYLRAYQALGKKVIFVADGNMTVFLPRLVELGVDGFMCENPATPLETVIQHFGVPGRFIIGGIDTARLTHGHPVEVRDMVLRLRERTRDCPGFAISSCGGLHDGIPMANLDAYFDARAEIGVTPRDWRDPGWTGQGEQQ